MSSRRNRGKKKKTALPAPKSIIKGDQLRQVVPDDLDSRPNAWEFAIDDQAGIDSTLWVRWCLKPPGAAFFKANGLNPLVLIVVGYPGREELEQRFLVNVEQCMERIWLRRPGVVKIHAKLLWRSHYVRHVGETDDHREIWKSYMPKDGGRFNTTLLDENMDPIVSWSRFQQFDSPAAVDAIQGHRFHNASYSVNVAAGMFAPEPPAWELSWLKRYGMFGKPDDQCNYRKMRLIGWPLNTLLFPFEILIKWIVTIVLLVFGASVGMYRMDARPLLTPWKYPLMWVWHNVDNNGSKKETPISDIAFFFKHSLLTALCPLALIMYSIIGIGAFHIRAPQILVLFDLGMGVGLYVIGKVCIKLLSGLEALYDLLHNLWLTRSNRKSAPVSHQVTVNTPRFVYVPSAVCQGDLRAEPFTPEVLAPKAQTRHLWFVATKGKVCKPYAS